MAILKTTLPGCDDDAPWHQAFKAILPGDKEEKKKVQFYLIIFYFLYLLHYICLYLINYRNSQIIHHIEKISLARKCSFISAATDIFSAKVSGTFKRLLSSVFTYRSTVHVYFLFLQGSLLLSSNAHGANIMWCYAECPILLVVGPRLLKEERFYQPWIAYQNLLKGYDKWSGHYICISAN